MISLFRSIKMLQACWVMRAKGAVSRVGLVLLVIWVAGCVEIPLEPAVPEFKTNRSIPSDASELFVIVRSRTGVPDRKVRWIVFVDGEARAILRGVPGYTRISLPPGSHEVIVAQRMRSYGIFLAFFVPIPLYDEIQAKTSLTCRARSRCGVAIDEAPPTIWRGLRMFANPVPENQLEHATRGMTFTEPDR
jgi:hypothetical protein